MPDYLGGEVDPKYKQEEEGEHVPLLAGKNVDNLEDG